MQTGLRSFSLPHCARAPAQTLTSFMSWRKIWCQNEPLCSQMKCGGRNFLRWWDWRPLFCAALSPVILSIVSNIVCIYLFGTKPLSKTTSTVKMAETGVQRPNKFTKQQNGRQCYRRLVRILGKYDSNRNRMVILKLGAIPPKDLTEGRCDSWSRNYLEEWGQEVVWLWVLMVFQTAQWACSILGERGPQNEPALCDAQERKE